MLAYRRRTTQPLSAFGMQRERERAENEALDESEGFQHQAQLANTAPGIFNPYLRKHAGSLAKDPAGLEALGRAIAQKRDQNSTLLSDAPSALLAGGGAWKNFDDYHDVRKIAAGLTGDKYNVVGGLSSGGGDLNSRPMNGIGETQQLNALPQSYREFDNEPLGTDQRRPATRVAASGGGMESGMSDAERFGLTRNQSPLMRLLMAQAEGAEFDLDQRKQGAQSAALAALAKLHNAPGTPNARAREERELAEGEADLDFKADRAGERFYRPAVAGARQDALQNQLRVARAPAEAAGAARLLEAQLQGGVDLEKTRMGLDNPIDILLQRLPGLFATYGSDAKTGEAMLPPEAQELRDLVLQASRGRVPNAPPPGPGRSGGAGPGANPQAGPVHGQRRPMRNGRMAIFLQDGPEGPDWYEE